MLEETNDQFTIPPQKRFPSEVPDEQSVEETPPPKHVSSFSLAKKIDKNAKERKEIKSINPISNPKKAAKKAEAEGLQSPDSLSAASIEPLEPVQPSTPGGTTKNTSPKSARAKIVILAIAFILLIGLVKYQAVMNLFARFNLFNASGTSVGPQITLAEKEYDFGTIPSDKVVEHFFDFTNTGDKDLEIKRIIASCSCVAGLPMREGQETRIFKPLETGQIVVKFNPKDRSGAQKRIVTIFTNDPALEQTRIFLSAVVTGGDGSLDAEPTLP